MEKKRNNYIVSYFASLAIFGVGLVCYFAKIISIPYWIMAISGVVLALTYIIIPDMCNKKSQYLPMGKQKYVWYILWIYDIIFLVFMAFLWLNK